jgi:hypothetical protein
MTTLRAVLAIAIGVLALSCDTAQPIDMYFGSDAGADYAPPPADAGPDALDAGALN